jgi:hypothetical protein
MMLKTQPQYGFEDYTERTWVFRKAGCVPRASGQGTPTRRSGPYGEEA